MFNERAGQSVLEEIQLRQQMDREMCPPGYKWMGKPINKCFAIWAGAGEKSAVENADTPTVKSKPTPKQAISSEMAARSQSKGRS